MNRFRQDCSEAPEGATHYNENYAFPFEKWANGERYVFLMGHWDRLKKERAGTKKITRNMTGVDSH